MSVRLPPFGLVHMVIAVALLLLALFVFASVQTAAQGHRLQESRRALERDVSELRAQQAELAGLLSYLGSDEYVEAFARQQFGLVRPGEIAVEVQAARDEPREPRPGDRWWESLFGRADTP